MARVQIPLEGMVDELLPRLQVNKFCRATIDLPI
jgi:hypothetical protein